MKLSPALILTAGLAILCGPIATAYAAEATGHGDGTTAPVGPSPDGENAIKAMKYDENLKISLFAAEPLLGNPVSFATDEKGRWYITESYRQERGIEDDRGHAFWLEDDLASRTVEDRLAMLHKYYPDPVKFAEGFTKYEDRITRVEDSNGDGEADLTTVVADGFNEPVDGTGAGIIVRGDEVWYTCIPNLWRIKVGPDGKAVNREKLLSGFGVHFALRGHDMHGLRFGPDGKLYFSIGDRGLQVTTREGKPVSAADTGSIMRCNPDGTGFEIFSSGVRNPQELAFDDHGNLFTGDNNSDAGDMARFHYLVEGGDCGWRTGFQYLPDRGPWMRERPWDAKEALKSKYINPPIANIGNGPSGLTYNPGTGLSSKYNGHFFMSDFRGGASASSVHEIALEPQGAFFKVKERRDFARGILTTDVEFGVDGGFYVLDWVESWGGVGKGRIYKFTDPAADASLQAETKSLIEEGMDKRSDDELGTLLSHADMRVRQAAQFALADREPAKSLPVFTKAARTAPTTLGRIHGIWGLGMLAGKNEAAALEPLLGLLTDGDSEVRAQAAHMIGDHKGTAYAEKLISLLRDPDNRVRYFAALSLGKLDCKAAFEPLCAMLAENNDQDPILRHGGVMGISLSATPQQLASKEQDPSVALRIAAVLALRRQQSSEIVHFLDDKDGGVVVEAARAINDMPIEPALPALGKLVSRKGLVDPFILSRAINAQFRVGGAESAAALAAFAADTAAPEAMRRDALEALAIWATPGPRDRTLNLFRPLPDRSPIDAINAATPLLPALLGENPGSVQEAAAKLAGKLNIASAADALFALAGNEQAGTNARIAAMQALGVIKDSRLSQVATIAVASKEPKVRAEGLQALAASDPAGAVRAIGNLLDNSTAGTVERQGALAALQQIKRPEAAALLAQLMGRVIAKTAPGEIQVDILEATKKANTPELNQLLADYQASLPAGDDLALYRVSLAGGDWERGRGVFRDKIETQCLRCHKCEIGDSQVGPDLTHIGATKDREYLLESIVFPNKHIATGFETVVLTLKDKSMVAGRLVTEENNTLQVETVDDVGKPKLMLIDSAQVEERIHAPSPMPETNRDFLSKAELRDLVEYLSTRR